MVAKQIGLTSKSASVSLADLAKVAEALGIQVNRDLRDIWGVSASVSALPNPDSINPGVWPIFIMDSLPDEEAGVHLTDHLQPYALVAAGETWSLSASHECLEMLVDPSGNWLISSSAVQVVNGEIQDLGSEKYEYLVEVSDPSEDPSNAYMINDVLVSDFYTPRFFDPVVAGGGVRYSFSGKITRPRQVLPGGYLSWVNPQTGKMQQLQYFEQPTIIDLPSPAPTSNRTTLRGRVDSVSPSAARFSRLPKDEAVVERRDVRAAWLASAGGRRSSAYLLASAPRPVPVSKTYDEVLDIIGRHKTELLIDGVSSVRPGWSFENDWITSDRAIIVKVDPNTQATTLPKLPRQIEGIPVEARPDSAIGVLARTSPTAFIAVTTGTRGEFHQPEFRGEIAGPSAPSSAISDLLAAKAKKQQIPYVGPANATLDDITEEMSIILHASPDAGWAQLQTFLGDIKHELIVGMYDFTSGHILEAVNSALDKKNLVLTLDHPARNKTADQSDDETFAALSQTLTSDLKFAWALTDTDTHAPVWIYPHAYHIKVAVKDKKSFWLSSGNWNNSNQPEIDLTDTTSAKAIAKKSDRDWHVICDNATLAKTFAAFLNNDYTVAFTEESKPKQITGMAASISVPVPDAILPTAAARAPMSFFPPKTISGKIRVQPLLTPDPGSYQPKVLELIKSATKTFYMQTQYIHTSDAANDAAHMELIQAIVDRIEAGVDVRLITSQYQTKDWIEKLKDAGVQTTDHLRIQANVHNKGITVDSKIVMVSSQNWSAEGTLRNRDAGVIIYNEEAAAYFEQIFLHDWAYLASAKSVD